MYKGALIGSYYGFLVTGGELFLVGALAVTQALFKFSALNTLNTLGNGVGAAIVFGPILAGALLGATISFCARQPSIMKIESRQKLNNIIRSVNGVAEALSERRVFGPDNRASTFASGPHRLHIASGSAGSNEATEASERVYPKLQTKDSNSP